MYLYEVAYTWYEDYSPRILTHEQKFNDDQWENLLQEAYKYAVHECVYTTEDFKSWLGCGDLIDKVVVYLIEHAGFQDAHFEHVHSLFGSNILEEHDFEQTVENYGTSITPLMKYVAKYKEEICEYNRRIRDKDDEEMKKSEQENNPNGLALEP